jgi:hypothetical protein
MRELFGVPPTGGVNVRCIDCLKDSIVEESMNEAHGGKFIAGMDYIMGGDGVCAEHARLRLKGPALVDEIHAMLADARKKKGKG